MLSFVVFQGAGHAGLPDAEALLRRHAHLMGADEVPLASTFSVEGSVIRCLKTSPDAAAFEMLWDAGSCGTLALRTCLLPERDEPYLLTLELARQRIMLFLNKLEDWLNGDLPASEPAMEKFEQARGMFTAALSAPADARGDFTEEQDRLAQQALELAIDAGERLALLVGEALMHQRLKMAAAMQAEGKTGPALWSLGCAAHREHGSSALQKVVADHFDFLVKPMRWTHLEPEEGEYAWGKTDKWVEWAIRTAKLPVAGGPLIDFRAGRTPEWLSIWENDYDTLREVAFEHIKKVVTRYRKAVTRWNVASGLHLNAAFPLTLEQVMDLTRLCVMVVRKLQPTARIILDIDQPFGERYARETRSIPPLLYAEMVVQQGVQIDALGLRVQMGDSTEGRATRDFMQLAALLDTFSQFDKPLVVTALGAPSEPPAPDAGAEDEGLGAATVRREGGWWRARWSQESQADWLTHALTICLSKPYVQSACWQELYDPPTGAGEPEMRAGGLISAEGKPKVALRRLGKIRQGMKRFQAPTRVAASDGPGAPVWTEAGEG